MKFFQGLCIKSFGQGLTALEWERLVLQEFAFATGEVVITEDRIVKCGYKLTDSGLRLAAHIVNREFA